MKKRLRTVLFIASLILALGLLYLILYRCFDFRIPCIFYEITGWSCPGCGLTRAAGALSRFAFSEALGYNPMFPVYILYVGWYFGNYALRYLRGDKNPTEFGPTWVHVAALVLTLAFGVLRNLLPIDTI